MAKFQKGQSGNPGGKPKELKGIQELARAHADKAIAALVRIATKGKSEAAIVAASVALIDRGYGKPTQTLAGDKDNPLSVGPVVVQLVQFTKDDCE